MNYDKEHPMRPLTLVELLALSPAKDWALPHFNVHNSLLAKGAVKAAIAESAPVALAVGYQSIAHVGMGPLSAYLKALIEESPACLALHFDHAKDLDMVKRALDLGFSSVMFDGSAHPFEENVRLTAEVVKMAHDKGASAEGELGVVPAPGASVSQIQYTDPDQAREFAARTGVDFLAVSLGSIHGMAAASMDIDDALLARLAGLPPLVLHGASGVTPEGMRKALKGGVRKINVNTALKCEAAQCLQQTFAQNPQRDLLAAMDIASDAVAVKAAEYIRLYQAAGRAPKQ